MNRGPDRITLAEDGTCVPDNLREPVSTRNFSQLRLWQLWQLRGGHPQDCMENAMHVDVTDKRYVQSFALADIANVRRLVEGTGPATVNKLVGWQRARIDDVFDDGPAFATLAEPLVDVAVAPERVEEFLLERLLARVKRNRKRIAGLKVFVPGDDETRALYYLRKGFRESDGDSEEFVWRP